jgi:hypothetical protein
VTRQSATTQRHRGGWLIRGLLALLATTAAALAVAVLPAAALATSPPSIETESVSYVTHNDATLEATINSEDLPEGAYYQVQLVKSPSEYLPELTCPEPEVLPPSSPDDCTSPDSSPHTPGALPIGYIAKGPQGQSVSLDMATAGVTLQPSTTYHYRVLVAKRVQREDGVNWQGPFVEGPDQTLTTLPPSTPPSEVLTGSAEPTPSGYNLNGKLNPDGLPTTYYYEYIGSNEVQCLNIEPGLERCWHETPHAGPITGNTQQEVPPLEVTGLTAGVTYHYRLVASNADGTVFGHEASFTVGSPPVVDSVSLSNLISSDATLQAQIDTEGLGTTYEFHMWSSCAHEACEYLANIPLPSGSLLGSFVPQNVSVDLASAGVTLRYGAEYGWGITATSAAGHTSVSGGVFEPPPPSMIEPLTTTTSPLSGAGQPARSDTNSGDQPAGSGASSSSSTPGVQPPGTGLGKTTKLEPFENAQKLSKALKLCDKKPKKQRPSCNRQAEKKYAATSKHRA